MENDKIKEIMDIYRKIEDTASMIIEEYIEMLQFYGNIDRRIAKKEIEVIRKFKKI